MNIHVAIKRFLPGFRSRLLVRRAINFPRDTFDKLTGRRDPLIPPHGLWFVGGEDNYQEVNEEFLRYFVELGNLRRNSKVLDVGCGIGVMASRLTGYLSPQGNYAGFDIVNVGIDWATKNITSRFPNFSFVHVDIFNKHYNPKGKLSPDFFRFPYEDGSFDFIFLKSIFTHLLPGAIQNYLAEIKRVLKPSGTCLATLFLMNSQSKELIDRGKSSLALSHPFEGCYVVDPEFPETVVGIPEEDFMRWCIASGLCTENSIRYGSWSGREEFTSYQDIVILRGMAAVTSL